MLAETEVPDLTAEVLALMDKEKLTGMLAIKTEHLLVASRCHLPENTVQEIRKDVQLIQGEIKSRESNNVRRS